MDANGSRRSRLSCNEILIPGQQRFWPDPQPLVERLGRPFFRQLPESPGVYLMLGESQTVLYVGKAKCLRRRLGSYRVANPERLPKRLLRLLHHVRHITWEECADESAALQREAELLRTLKPRFNRAGVWPNSPRFLLWRAQPGGLELAVAGSAETGWQAAGPFGAQAHPLLQTLVRLLWCRFQPDRGLAAMPAGWFREVPNSRLTLPSSHDDLVEQTLTQLDQLFAQGIEHGAPWLTPPAAAFDRACWEEDVAWLTDTVTRHRRKQERRAAEKEQPAPAAQLVRSYPTNP